MGLLAQLGTGAGFIVVGLWKAQASMRAFSSTSLPSSRSSNKQRRRASPGVTRYVEHLMVALLAVLHMVFNLITAEAQARSENNGAGVGVAFALERLGVAAIFLLYAVVALLSEGTPALPLPAGIVDLISVFAFIQEFTLFYVTSGETSEGLEVHYYSLLLVPIGVCLLATVSEIAYPAAVLPPLVRGSALILQGTWFLQMGLSLFTRSGMAQGCERVQESEGVSTVSCAGMSLMRGRALATLQFNCHLALLLVILLPMYGLLSKTQKVPSNYQRLGGDSQPTEDGREGQQLGQELTQRDYLHVLGEEDEEAEEIEEEVVEVQAKDTPPESNGFHRVVI